LLDVELWPELRREHFVRGVSIKKLERRTGLSRNTIRRALRSDVPPAYRREPAGSMLDPYKDEIHRLLKDDPTLTGVRIREELEPLGFAGGKTIVDEVFARGARVLSAAADVPADGVSAGGDLPMGSVAAQPGDPGRARADPARL
jgi:transposase